MPQSNIIPLIILLWLLEFTIGLSSRVDINENQPNKSIIYDKETLNSIYLYMKRGIYDKKTIIKSKEINCVYLYICICKRKNKSSGNFLHLIHQKSLWYMSIFYAKEIDNV
jgi:hypothetical protein